MSTTEDHITVIGTIKEAYPGVQFCIELENGHTVRASICGKMRRTHFKLIPGDKVKVEISFYDLTKGMIVQRLNPDLSEIKILKKQSFKKGSARRRKQ